MQEQAVWLKSFGDANHMPEPWEEISEHEFWHEYYHNIIRSIDLRYITNLENGRKVWIHWYDTLGLAVCPPVSVRYIPKLIYLDSPRYFWVGCRHKWVEYRPTDIPVFTFEHHYRCEDCGLTKMEDSS